MIWRLRGIARAAWDWLYGWWVTFHGDTGDKRGEGNRQD